MSPTFTRFESHGFLPVGTPKTLVYAFLVENQEALHRTVDACQTIRNCPGVFEQILYSMMRRVEACIQSHGAHFEHLFAKNILFHYNSRIVFGSYVDMNTFVLFWYADSYRKFVRTFQLHCVLRPLWSR
jgi:hypothetical protein